MLLLANNLEYRYPRAAASLREGLEETLTVHRLNVPGLLQETLSSTNPLELANSVCRGIIRRVSNFKNGGMALRHAAAGFMGAEHGFHRVRGYKHMSVLVAMLGSQEVKQSVTGIAWPGAIMSYLEQYSESQIPRRQGHHPGFRSLF